MIGLGSDKNPNLLETQKIWTCLKVVLGTERWTCPSPHSSSADVSQSIVNTFSLRSRYEMWRNHDMMTICAYDSEHDPRQYEGKRSCLFQENTGNKVTTRWEGPQSLSYKKYSISKNGLLCTDSCVFAFVKANVEFFSDILIFYFTIFQKLIWMFL